MARRVNQAKLREVSRAITEIMDLANRNYQRVERENDNIYDKHFMDDVIDITFNEITRLAAITQIAYDKYGNKNPIEDRCSCIDDIAITAKHLIHDLHKISKRYDVDLDQVIEVYYKYVDDHILDLDDAYEDITAPDEYDDDDDDSDDDEDSFDDINPDDYDDENEDDDDDDDDDVPLKVQLEEIEYVEA